MHNLKEIKIWHRAIDLTVDLYKATENFPKDERYGLTSQMRRSAVSIPSNIAEGAGRNNPKEFAYFIGISNGSSYELQTQLIIANRLKLVDDKTAKPLLKEIDEIQKMTRAFLNKINNE